MKIMVCHDGSERAQRALAKTIDIFKAEKPEVYILTVIEPPLDATSTDEANFEKWQEKRKGDLRKAAEYVAANGFRAHAVLAEGDPRKMIVEAVETKSPDLLIMAKRSGGMIDKVVLGSVSDYMVRHAACPVMIIH
ncbi:MAG: universal stress protein [Thermodesulfobacteriota bacterium]